MALDPNIILQAGRAQPIDPAALFEAGNRIALGRLAVTRGRQTQDALDRVRASPDDPDAITALAAVDPAAGNAYRSAQADKRALAARPALAALASSLGGNGSSAPAANDAGTAPHALDHSNPAMQSLGQTVASKQLSPADAFAQAITMAGPEAVNSVIGSYKNLDEVQQTKIQRANAAAGQAALHLIQNVPDDPAHVGRMAALRNLAPQLQQAGVDASRFTDLSDQGLHGVVGQATTVAAGIEQANKDRDFALDVRKEGEAERSHRAEEGKGILQNVTNADGSTTSRLVNPITGSQVGGGAGSAAIGAAWKVPQLSSVAQDLGGRITSGLRTPDHNAAIGGATNSQHLAGTAIDVVFPKGTTIAQVQAAYAAKGAPVQVIHENAGDPHSTGDHFHIQAVRQAPGSARSGALSGSTGTPGGFDDKSIEFYAQAVATGGAKEMPALGMGRQAALVRQRILSRSAQIQSGNGQTGADFVATGASVQADKAGLSALQRRATVVGAAEQAAQANGRLALSLSQVNGNGNVPIFNAWRNAGGKNTGDPTISKFNAAVETFANEYATVMGKGVPTDSLRSHAHDMINTSQSPQQFRGVVQTLQTDMANVRTGLEGERQETLRRISGGGRTQGTLTANLPTFSPDQARNAPKGTRFRTTDGRVMVRQ